ncbi:hypothetical protein APSETT444_009160 [Aspergillus pseudonomiae]
MSLDRQESVRHDESKTSRDNTLAKLTQLPPSSASIKEASSGNSSKLVGDIKGRIAEPVVAAFIAGGVAGAVSRTIVSPLERLKILLQIQSVGREEYKLSIWKALVKIGKEEGWRGFMRGNGTNCIRIIPYSAVQFGSYNFYKRFAEPAPDAELSPVRRLICGGAAGITSVTITYPLDIVRTRLSIQSASFAALGQRDGSGKLPGMFSTMVLIYKTEGGILALYRGIIPTVAGVAPYINTMSGMGYQYASVWDAVKVIVAEEGTRGLFKGIVPNLLKVAPSMASSWLSFELTRDFLVQLNDK